MPILAWLSIKIGRRPLNILDSADPGMTFNGLGGLSSRVLRHPDVGLLRVAGTQGLLELTITYRVCHSGLLPGRSDAKPGRQESIFILRVPGTLRHQRNNHPISARPSRRQTSGARHLAAFEEQSLHVRAIHESPLPVPNTFRPGKGGPRPDYRRLTLLQRPMVFHDPMDPGEKRSWGCSRDLSSSSTAPGKFRVVDVHGQGYQGPVMVQFGPHHFSQKVRGLGIGPGAHRMVKH